MLEILQFYVSNFWVWLGITIGLYIAMIAVVGVGAGLTGALGGGRKP